ncbi:hypothetical protein CEK71_15405 [Methylovulum psychrotolerans]|uniref:Uncharacterized protein n=2 Tax=Methylovulum psychrotolerans TaxID=1704499 RepID=A0A1Z4C1G0_9GAMM|nr:hypothetical protein [Methylovulum psychrotolerans]ASF47339.1 hypothetical protein CEK71_15405 [Methylovulum psychrotolerans]POZ50858.1 hypothetical protein AADEFJLK_03330 [Methylovulum psychrotolerans]
MSLINYLFTHCCAVVFLILAGFMASVHVFAPVPLVLLGLYLGVLAYYPKAWLVAVPALLPILDLSLWTGNLLYNEYDILLSATLAVLYWRKDVEEQLPSPPYRWLYWVLLAAFSASFLQNVWPLFQDTVQPDDIYQGNWNSLRLGKGFFYAWLLWPFMRRELLVSPERSQRLLATGIVASLWVFGLLVLWERHVLGALLSFHDRYEALSAFLDFASTYRITGWFTDMHVGGEAVDGYLVSLTPLAVYLLTRPLRPLAFNAVLLAVGAGFYAIIVTFTRTTIASFSLSMLVTLIVFLVGRRQTLKKTGTALAAPLLLLAVGLFGLVLGFKMAGYQALLVGLLAVVAATLCTYYAVGWGWVWQVLAGLALAGLAAWGISDSALESKWHTYTEAEALRLAVLLAVAQVGLGLLLGRTARKLAIALKNLQVALIFVGLFALLAIGMSSERFEERFAQVGNDLSTREQHWQQMLSFRTPDSLSSLLIGEGIGTIPSLFYQNTLLTRRLPDFHVAEDSGQPVLLLGPSDMTLIQKLILPPHQHYQLTVTARFKSISESLGLRVCKKHILFSDHYPPSCLDTAFKPAQADRWETFHWEFDHAGHSLLDWPTTLIIHNSGVLPVAIRAVALDGSNGEHYIRNGQFADKLQSWLWTIDFDHLPWHSKQLFIHLWLEQGWVGVGVFVVLVVLVCRRQLGLLAKGETVPLAFLPALAAVLLEGLTGTMLDAPRVSTQIYLILFAALQWPEVDRPLKQAKRQRLTRR